MSNFYYPGKKQNNKKKWRGVEKGNIAKVGSKVCQVKATSTQLSFAHLISSQFGWVQFSSVKFGSDVSPIRSIHLGSCQCPVLRIPILIPIPNRPCLLHILWPILVLTVATEASSSSWVHCCCPSRTFRTSRGLGWGFFFFSVKMKFFPILSSWIDNVHMLIRGCVCQGRGIQGFYGVRGLRGGLLLFAYVCECLSAMWLYL